MKVGDRTSSNMLPTAAITLSVWAYSSTWSSQANTQFYSNTEVGGMSLGTRIDGVTAWNFCH